MAEIAIVVIEKAVGGMAGTGILLVILMLDGLSVEESAETREVAAGAVEIRAAAAIFEVMVRSVETGDLAEKKAVESDAVMREAWNLEVDTTRESADRLERAARIGFRMHVYQCRWPVIPDQA